MRRLPALAAALAVLAGSLAAGGAAVAKDHHDGPRGEQRGEPQGRGRGDDGRWAGGRGEGPGNGRWSDRRPDMRGEGRSDPRYDPRYDQRYDPRYDPRGDPRGDPRYDPRAYGQAPSYATPRRGGYLGPEGGAPIENPDRYRLRAAPRGYQWVRVPGGMALVSQATGQVFDVVPY